MTDKKTTALEKLNDELAGEKHSEAAISDAPQWAIELFEQVNENSRRLAEAIEQQQEQREAALDELGQQIKTQMQENRKRIVHMEVTNPHIRTPSAVRSKSADSTEEKSSEWDEMLGGE